MKQNKLFKLWLLAVILFAGSGVTWGQTEQLIYSTGFESSESFTAGTTYNNTTIKYDGATGQQWGTYFGTASTTGPITGSMSMQMRYYTATSSNLGYTFTNFNLAKVTKVTFKALNTSGNNVSVSYSTDGGSTYTGAQTFTLGTSAASFTYNISSTGEYTNVRIKFTLVPGTTSGSRITIDDLAVYGMVGTTPTVATPTFSPNAGTFYSSQNVTISSTTDGAAIYYTTDGSDPNNTGNGTLYSSAIPVSATTTIKAKAYKDSYDASGIASATYTFPTINEVTNIAALRSGATDGTVYKLTGEAILTLKSATRNAKYIQDATGGILIDDNTGKITTTYNVGDGITGITGTLTTNAGMLQFVPVTNPGTASSTGNTVTPIVTTLTNMSNYPGQLVKISGLTITGTGNFVTATNYTLSDGTNSGVLRTHYSDLPYIGSPIPSGLQDITGVVLMYNTTAQLIPRTSSDFTPTVSTTPTITVTETTVPAMSAQVGSTDTQTITVSGSSLTGNITLALSGTDASLFSLDKTSLTPTSGTITDEIVTITYTPTSAGSHTATLTLSSDGATNVTRTLNGTVTWPPLDAPVATAATDITSTGFTANWNAVSGATEYEVSVFSKIDAGSVEKFKQEFTWTDNSTGGNDNLWSGTIASATTGLADHLTGWTITAGYKANYCIKMGSSGTQGVLTTPALGLNGDATLTFRAGAWDGTSEQTELLLEISGGGSLNMSSITMVKAAFTNYSVTITGGSATTKITFKGKLASNSRFFLDDVVISEGGITTTAVSGSPFTVSSGTTLAVTSLTPGTQYVYTVKAKNTNVTSTASNEIAAITDVNNTTNASTLPDCPTCEIVVKDGGELNVNATKTYNKVTVKVGGKLTLASGSALSAPITIESDENGTGTLVDNGTLTVNGTATVQQYLASQRNWYMSSPVFEPTRPSTTDYSYVESYDETLSSNNWINLGETNKLLTAKGYVVYPATTGEKTITFTGTLNTGDKTIVLTRTAANTTYQGFNLVGNPYPSYLNIDNLQNNTDIVQSVWYRAQNASNTYVFDTYNIPSGLSTGLSGKAVTKFIPPMQAFWLRVAAGKTSATVNFLNANRGHIDNTNNVFRAPQAVANQILRLQLTNGTATDETVLYFNANAANGYDAYDSPKMLNNGNTVPNLYTTVGTEKLVINGMNAIPYNVVLPLSLQGAAGTYTITASEFSNFAEGDKVQLIDTKGITTDLTPGSSYTFSIAAGENTTGRFSVVFPKSSVPTGVDNAGAGDVTVFTRSSRIVVTANEAAQGSMIYVFNGVGQRLAAQAVSGTVNEIGRTFPAGVYVVKVNNTTAKVVVKQAP